MTTPGPADSPSPPPARPEAPRLTALSSRLTRWADRFANLLRRVAGLPHGIAQVWHWLERRGHHRHPVARVTGRWGGLLAVTTVGVVLGVLLGGSLLTHLGPFHARLSIVPSLSGGTEVSIPPLGSLRIRSHSGPVHLLIQLESLDEAQARALVSDPQGIEAASDRAVSDLDSGVRRLALHAAGAGILGALLLAGLIYRSVRRVAISGCLAIAIIATSGVLVVTTFRPNAIQEPRYEGLLTNAPAVVGDARRIADRFQAYREQLQRLVGNVSQLYTTVSTLPVYEPDTRAPPGCCTSPTCTSTRRPGS